MRNLVGMVSMRQVVQFNGEFVATQPGCHILRADRLVQTLGDFTQQLVARLVAQRVSLTCLKTIEINKEHSEQMIGTTRQMGEAMFQILLEHQTIGQASQIVVISQSGELLVKAFEVERHFPQRTGQIAQFVRAGKGGCRCKILVANRARRRAQLLDRAHQQIMQRDQEEQRGKQAADQGDADDRTPGWRRMAASRVRGG